MSAIKLGGCSKSAGGKRPEVVERLTLPTEDNPWLWNMALVAIFCAAILLLYAVPRTPEPIKWERVERELDRANRRNPAKPLMPRYFQPAPMLPWWAQ